jgi:hypothetical protein
MRLPRDTTKQVTVGVADVYVYDVLIFPGGNSICKGKLCIFFVLLREGGGGIQLMISQYIYLNYLKYFIYYILGNL